MFINSSVECFWYWRVRMLSVPVPDNVLTCTIVEVWILLFVDSLQFSFLLELPENIFRISISYVWMPASDWMGMLVWHVFLMVLFSKNGIIYWRSIFTGMERSLFLMIVQMRVCRYLPISVVSCGQSLLFRIWWECQSLGYLSWPVLFTMFAVSLCHSSTCHGVGMFTCVSLTSSWGIILITNLLWSRGHLMHAGVETFWAHPRFWIEFWDQHRKLQAMCMLRSLSGAHYSCC